MEDLPIVCAQVHTLSFINEILCRFSIIYLVYHH